MKSKLLIFALVLMGMSASTSSYGQMNSSWFQGKGKYVCAAYEYGKFSGETGKRLKYSPRGRQTVRGRSHSKMQYHARKNRQKKLWLFMPHNR